MLKPGRGGAGAQIPAWAETRTNFSPARSSETPGGEQGDVLAPLLPWPVGVDNNGARAFLLVGSYTLCVGDLALQDGDPRRMSALEEGIGAVSIKVGMGLSQCAAELTEQASLERGGLLLIGTPVVGGEPSRLAWLFHGRHLPRCLLLVVFPSKSRTCG